MKGFKLSDFKKNTDGTYSMNKAEQPVKSKKGRPSLIDGNKLIDMDINEDGSVKIVFYELFPGLNGDNGLMRMHWSEKDNLKSRYKLLLLSVKPRKFDTKVSIEYTRFSSGVMDEDNLAASFKLIGDALKEMKIIADDSPEWLHLKVNQEKVGKKEIRSEILIKEFSI